MVDGVLNILVAEMEIAARVESQCSARGFLNTRQPIGDLLRLEAVT